MSSAVSPRQRTAGAGQRSGVPATADVLVIFGITGDLAKVMTFRSLYRLERRGLLDCPIVGVAGDDWTSSSFASTPPTASRAPARSSTARCSTASPRAFPT